MQRLVHIGFRHGNVILEPPRNRLIHLMDDSQRPIAVFHRIYDNTHRKQIVNLVNGLILIFHFLVNAEKVLYAPVYLRLNPRMCNMPAHFADNVLDIPLPLALTGRYLIHQVIINLRFQIFQR